MEITSISSSSLHSVFNTHPPPIKMHSKVMSKISVNMKYSISLITNIVLTYDIPYGSVVAVKPHLIWIVSRGAIFTWHRS